MSIERVQSYQTILTTRQVAVVLAALRQADVPGRDAVLDQIEWLESGIRDSDATMAPLGPLVDESPDDYA